LEISVGLKEVQGNEITMLMAGVNAQQQQQAPLPSKGS